MQTWSSFPVDAEGAFETHVTFRPPADGLPDPAAWGRARGWDLTDIVLARGVTPAQPMFSTRSVTTLGAARERAAALAEAARAAGFEPVRVKIEVSPAHPAVPRDDAAARALGPAYHFEHHVKVLLDDDPLRRAHLIGLVAPYGAHLSRNARRRRGDGCHERFVTTRRYGVGLPRALADFGELRTVLGRERYVVISAESEFVVYDSRAGLDAGWLPEGDRAARVAALPAGPRG